MTQFTSGTQTLRRRQADPEPWVFSGTSTRTAWKGAWGLMQHYDPRPEYESTVPVVHHDPEPWRCPECEPGSFGERMAKPAEWCGLDIYDPRPEFVIRDNPILLALREREHDIYDLMLDLDSYWADRHFTREEIEHAREVLERLAYLHVHSKIKK